MVPVVIEVQNLKVLDNHEKLNFNYMEAFAPTPPEWTNNAIHAHQFCCPNCKSSSREALQVWLNRRSPVMTEDHRRKWQEFYNCHCGNAWWAWSSDRPPIDLSNQRDIKPM